MPNKIFTGEKLGFVGQLLDGETVVTGVTIKCQVLSPLGYVIQEVTADYDSTNQNYYGLIDTAKLEGEVSIRFVVVSGSGDKVVSNNSISTQINK